MGKLVDIENIDYVRLEDSLHCLEHHKGDEVECVICAPLVEAIPKSEYEARLKADMVAMLEDLDLQIDESTAYNTAYNPEVEKVHRLIRDEINVLKGGNE
jgi:hypothetical protein